MKIFGAGVVSGSSGSGPGQGRVGRASLVVIIKRVVKEAGKQLKVSGLEI